MAQRSRTVAIGATFCTNTRSAVLGVALRWRPRGGERSTFDGSDSSGRRCGYVNNISGRWTVYLTPWACDRGGGLVLGPFEDGPAAMAVADEYAAAPLMG
jgi:hypothetical protein